LDTFAKILPNLKKFKEYIEDVSKSNFPINLSGLNDSAKSHFIYATKYYTNRPVLVVTYNDIELKKIKKDLDFFTDENITIFPKRDIVYYDVETTNKDAVMDRLSVYSKLYNSQNLIILTTIEALMQKTLPKSKLFKDVIEIEIGKEYKLENIKQRLINLGYERDDLCDSRGKFSIRGGIIDVFPLNTKHPMRIEFWGDEVDSIRYFDATSQRSIDTLNSISIFPVDEFLVEKEKLPKIAKDILKKYPEKEDDADEILNGNYQNKIEKYFEFFFNNTVTLLDYILKDTILFIDEPSRIKSKCQSIEFENKEILNQYLEKYKINHSYTSSMASFAQTVMTLEELNTINLYRIDENMLAKRNGYSFSCREVNFFRGEVDIFVQEIEEERKRGKKIIYLSNTPSKCKTVEALLQEHNINALYVSKENIKKLDAVILEKANQLPIFILEGSLNNSIAYLDLDIIITSENENLVVKEKKKSYKPKAFLDGKKVVFADLKVGDYVVHSSHGIGKYLGIFSLTVEGIRKDFLKIEYKDSDTLYVPTVSLDTVRKYIGQDEDYKPKLNKLGSKDFEKIKSKVKSSVKDIAKQLVMLYSKRAAEVGYSFSKDTVWQNDFEESFPYQETDDQLRCIEEVKSDMESNKPMDRLLCGDVGYGKTEVAIRAAFKACMDSKQVAYLTPTTVLAQQQYETFAERMKDYPIKVEVLNRFKTTKEKNEIVKKLKNGEIDILIGTHRILGKDVKFKDLGLLIIDEEHRFGVTHKEKIKELKSNVDVLTMTATPIPRTLQMSIVGIRDMSVIYDPPQDRKPIQTYVLEYDEEVIKEAILSELERNGQVFYLYNNVEKIEQKASYISRLIPEAKIAFAHGRMQGKEIESIMEDFSQKNIDVLICTTIMESGIDIPNANTMIIEDADRLGLAQLYQIRGRVGRSNKKAYAYITYRKNKLLSETSEKRLKAIKEFSEFGSGFKIALRDLEIRGAGNILGAEQSGHLEQVGYEMYNHFLEQAVKEIQGEKIENKFDIQIDLKVSAFIPDDYIENNGQKIETYQDIANIESESQIMEMCDELIDRYGELPDEVLNLLEIARIRAYCKKIKINKISQKGENILFQFLDASIFKENILQDLLSDIKYKRRIFISGDSIPYLTLKLQSQNESDILKDVLNILKYFKVTI